MNYHELIQRLRLGERLDPDAIGEALAAAGRSGDDLIRALFDDPQPRAGDACPCGAKLYVTHTRRQAGRKVQYLGCRLCGFRPARNKVIFPRDATG